MGAAREKTLVGVFVLVAGVVLFGAVLALTGGIGAARVPMHTYFAFSGGLDAGGTVRYGGLSVGKITHVRIDPADSTRILVDFTVSPDTPVRIDSVARVSSLGLLSDSFLEISPGTKTSPRAPAGSELQSRESLGIDQLGDTIATLMPDAQSTLKTLNTDLGDLQTTIHRANDLLDDKNRANIAGSLNSLNGALAELRPELNQTLKHLDETLADAKPKVSATLTSLQGVTKKLDPLVDDLTKTLKTTNDTIAHLDGTLGDNRQDLRASVTSLRRALEQSTVLLDQLNGTLSQNSDNIDQTLENVRMATENLRQLTDMLKTSPASIIRGTGIKDRKPGDSPR
jgi:phospholipid/cholesterol/gamma-HCH transport system substrate-binding protein